MACIFLLQVYNTHTAAQDLFYRGHAQHRLFTSISTAASYEVHARNMNSVR